MFLTCEIFSCESVLSQCSSSASSEGGNWSSNYILDHTLVLISLAIPFFMHFLSLHGSEIELKKPIEFSSSNDPLFFSK